MADVRFVSGIQLHHADRKPLHYAAETRSLRAMSLLLNTDATEESIMEKLSGMTAWHMAARYGGKAALKFLLARFGDSGPGLTEKSDDETSPLAEAVLGEDQDSAFFLLELTRPDGSDPGGPPLIHLSTTFGMSKLTTRLIEAGFDPLITSQKGAHALVSKSHPTPLNVVEDSGPLPLPPELCLDEHLVNPSAWMQKLERMERELVERSLYLNDLVAPTTRAVSFEVRARNISAVLANIERMKIDGYFNRQLSMVVESSTRRAVACLVTIGEADINKACLAVLSQNLHQCYHYLSMWGFENTVAQIRNMDETDKSLVATSVVTLLLDLAIISFAGAHLESFDERYLGKTVRVFEFPQNSHGDWVWYYTGVL
jgi:hypothetical protein